MSEPAMSKPLREALERHRDSSPPRVEFSVPIDRLVDDSYCSTLSKDLTQLAEGWERIRATPSAHDMIPESPGLYMFVWEPGISFRRSTGIDFVDERFRWILYVGMAGGPASRGTLRQRYRRDYAPHIGRDPELLFCEGSTGTRKDRLARFLNLEPLYYWYCVAEDVGQLEDLERRIFNLLSPPLNDRGSPRLRAVGKPRKAF